MVSIPQWFPPLQVLGLLVDILGTFIIAAPDIPYVNRRLSGGRLREGRTLLESGNLTPSSPGYDAILEELEFFSGSEISRRPEVLDVRLSGLSLSSEARSDRIVCGDYTADENEETETQELMNRPYRDFAIHLRRQIQKKESLVRVVGFLILAGGFTIQIFGLTW
jgi:hypothetical protein